LAQSRGGAERLRAGDGCGALEELRDAREVDVAATKDHDDAITRDHGDVPEEECGECGGASGLHHLLEALHREPQPAEDLFVGEGDEAIKE
jgi:hypothetical protein